MEGYGIVEGASCGLALQDKPVQSWDVRAAVCAVGSRNIEAHSDEVLVFLLRNAVDKQTIDDLFHELFRRYQSRVTSSRIRCDLGDAAFSRKNTSGENFGLGSQWQGDRAFCYSPHPDGGDRIDSLRWRTLGTVQLWARIRRETRLSPLALSPPFG